MSEQVLADDQSHYEISLTAGQAFIAFVLMLLSLAASFGFGLMIGKTQGDDRLVVRREAAVVNEARVAGGKTGGRIVELGVAGDDFQKQTAAKSDTATTAPVLSEEASTSTTADPNSAPPSPAGSPARSAAPVQSPSEPAGHSSVIEAAPGPGAGNPQAARSPASPAGASPVDASRPVVRSGPAYAQLLSTADQKTAETLAASLINGGFTSAYVERGTSPRGPIFRVRVKFGSESDAYAAVAKLKAFSGDVWITR